MSRMLATGIVIEHHAHRQRVVEIEPIGLLLGAAIRGDRQAGKRRDLERQRLVVGRQHAAIGDAVDAVLAGDEITREKFVPGGEIDAPTLRLVAHRPAPPRIGRGRGAGGRRNRRQRQSAKQATPIQHGASPSLSR
jgi:hypothetical protein